MTTSANDDTEEILVLYGSQTGNSESAAEQIHAAIPTKLPTTSSKDGKCCTTTITARLMHLDDFLELEYGKWTRLIIVVCSSYGVGQAPLGARKFREFCDEILKRHRDGDGHSEGEKNDDDTKVIPSLRGVVNFALLGLGDSHYSTYFKNPTTIHDALLVMGAKRVGEIGKADASGTGHMEQSKVIERWIENIWAELDNVVMSTPSVNTTDLDQVRKETWDFCLEIFPDWKKQHSSAAKEVKKKSYYLAINIMVGILLALIARYSYEIVEVLKIDVTGVQLQRISGILFLFIPIIFKLL